jgi:hypothetical protein
MKAPMTRDKYKARLAKFLDFIGIEDGNRSLEDKARTFAKKSKSNLNWAFANLLKFIQFQKYRVDKKEIAAATVRNYVKSIKLFCEMADIPIPCLSGKTRGLLKALSDCLRPKKRSFFSNSTCSSSSPSIVSVSDNHIEEMVYLIKAYYQKGSRQNLILGLSGLSYKGGVGLAGAEKSVMMLCDITGDEEKSSVRLGTLVALPLFAFPALIQREKILFRTTFTSKGR